MPSCWCTLRDASFCQPVSHGETCQEPQAVYGLACPHVPSSTRGLARIADKTLGVLHRVSSALVALVPTACLSHAAGLTLVASPTIHHVVVYVESQLWEPCAAPAVPGAERLREVLPLRTSLLVASRRFLQSMGTPQQGGVRCTRLHLH